MSEEPIDPRFADNPTNAKGEPRQRRPAFTPEEREKVIEEVRTMIILDFNPADIKKQVSKRWKVSTKYAGKLISVANSINRTCLNQTTDENLAASLGYWSRKKQTAEQTIQQERGMLTKANDAIAKSTAEVEEIEQRQKDEGDSQPADTERLQILEMRIKNAVRIREQARVAIYSSEMLSKECQREIDRLKGNHAPVKIAKTDAQGNDLPMTAEERRERLRALGVPPVAGLPEPKQIQATIIDVESKLSETAPMNGTNGHSSNGHANGKTNGILPGLPPISSNGHASTNGDSNHSESEHQPDADDELQ